MYKALLALAAGAGAFSPAVHQRATVVQQGVPLANGAMEFDRTAPASGIDRCAATTCVAGARAHACNTRTFDDAGVCREWRCKYEGDKATSASLEACSKVLDEYLPELKKIDGVTVNRAVQCPSMTAWTHETHTGLVCGGCLDFKVMVTQPLEGYGPWEEAGHPPEADFIAKLKAIPGVSQVETQTITNMVL